MPRGKDNQPHRARPLVARFLRFQDRIRISEAACKIGSVTWDEHRIMVFADYSKLLSERPVQQV